MRKDRHETLKFGYKFKVLLHSRHVEVIGTLIVFILPVMKWRYWMQSSWLVACMLALHPTSESLAFHERKFDSRCRMV